LTSVPVARDPVMPDGSRSAARFAGRTLRQAADQLKRAVTSTCSAESQIPLSG
jgi:hypothetical protein